MSHLGDPCIHCKVPAMEVGPGPCPNAEGNAARIRRFLHYKELLAKHTKESESETKRLSALIQTENTGLLQIENGLDFDQIRLAESVMYVHGDYEKAGDDRLLQKTAAIHWFATGGEPTRYNSLKHEYFGTKTYDRWYGQGSNHSYGYGPKHGSIIFSIGLKPDARKRDLTHAEREACVYYLMNLSAIQAAQKKAKEQSAL